MSKSKLKGEYHEVWCIPCKTKIPSIMTGAACMIPVRKGHYDLKPDSSDIDRRVMGVCENCRENKSDFQRGEKQRLDVDPNNPHLVYRVNNV